MNYDIQPRSIVITTFVGSTCALDLREYEDLIIRYNKRSNNISIIGSKLVTETLLVPMTLVAAAKNKEVPAPPSEEKSAVKGRNFVAESTTRSKHTNRKIFNKGKHVLTVLPTSRIVEVIMEYRKGGDVRAISVEVGIRYRTLYKWASVVNRLVLGKPTGIADKSRLHVIAAEIKAKHMSEFHTYQR